MNETAELAPPRRWNSSGVLIVAVILAVLVAALISSIQRPIRGSRITMCEDHLSQLVKAMYNYAVTKMPVEGQFPPDLRGEDFWLILYKTKEVEDPKVFDCPVRPTGQVAPLASAYQGPSGDPNTYRSNDAIGADDRSLDTHGHSSDPSVAYCWVAKNGDAHQTPNDMAAKWAAIESKVKP
jgi:type II secretory pathway pseudopilin PulG